MSGKAASAGTHRRTTLLLALLAAAEAAVIVALLVAREPEAAPASTTVPGSSPAIAAPPVARAPEPRALPAPVAVIRAEAAVPAAESLRAVAPSLEALGVVLCGSVRSSAGVLLDSAEVVIEQGGATRVVDVAGGNYALAGVSPGPASLTCSAEGFLPRSATLDLDAARPLERVDFVLDVAATLSVRCVTPDGRSLGAALEEAGLPRALSAVATLEAPAPGAQPEGVSRWNATPDDPWIEGRLELDAPLPVHVSALWNERVLATQPVGTAGQDVVFVLTLEALAADLASVDGRLVDGDTRAPVAGALVLLGDEHVTTDAGGTFAFDTVLPGTHRLDVESPQTWAELPGGTLIISGQSDLATHSRRTLALELHSGQHLALGDVALQATCEVVGRVVTAEGPATGVQVEARRLDTEEDSEWRRRREVAVGADGRFALRLEHGRWRFLATGPEAQSPAVVVEACGGHDEVLLRLGACAPVSLALLPGDATLVRRVVVRDGAGVPLHELSCGGPLPLPSPWVLHLPSGAYTCEVHDVGGALLWQTAFAVGERALQLLVPLG